MKIEINLKIILALILFLIIDNINTYIIFIIFILIHEIAHLLIGIIIGGVPNKLRITPFGASLEFFSYGKNNPFYRILFYGIGPLINFIIAVFFLKLENYNYFKYEIIYTNLAIGFFNLIPILPLDGGKILRELLKIFVGTEKANKFAIIFSKFILVLISFLYAILIIKIKNIMFLFLLIYLWYLYNIEQKKFYIYQRANNCIKNII